MDERGHRTEEEEDDDYIGPRAFRIDGEAGPEAGPPLDGFDYLRRVRWAPTFYFTFVFNPKITNLIVLKIYIFI